MVGDVGMKVSSLRLDANFTAKDGEKKGLWIWMMEREGAVGKSAGGMSKTRRGACCTQSANFPKMIC